VGRRSEQRIAVFLPVTVRGLNSRGIPFEVKAETRDISFSGACLRGLNGIASPGAKIELESNGRKAWYRVAWEGDSGSAYAGLIGARSLEYGRYIWGIAPKGWEPDTYEVPTQVWSKNADAPSGIVCRWHGPERRQFARRVCDIDVTVATDDGSMRFRSRISEISLGGCVIDIASPLPVDTTLKLSFALDGAFVDLTGTICSSRLGQGVGITFTTMSPAAFEALRKFAPPAVAPRATPQDNPASSIADSTAESVGAILILLQRKGIFTAAEFTEEVDRIKNQRVGVPA
jgi:hypothetical protein